MKKKLYALLSLVVVIGILAGCGGGGTSDEPSGGGSTSGETYVITLTHATAETTSLHAGSEAFKEYVEEHSDGRILVNIYPNAQLGSDRETIEGVQTGEITMMSSSNAVQVNFVPDAVIFDMPFCFSDSETARATMADEAFTEAISAAYAAAGFHYMGVSDQGFRTLTANKEIRTPADCQGLTIRTMENKYHMATWEAIGANPTPLAFNELYTALQQGTVDAQENPIELICSQKFYEQQDYVISTNHILQSIVWIMNEDFYQSLPDDLKTVVDEASAYAVQAANEFQDENLAINTQTIKDYGVEFIELTPEEIAAFEDATSSIGDMIQADCSAEVYDAFTAAVEANR